jgi:hypothetical protein
MLQLLANAEFRLPKSSSERPHPVSKKNNPTPMIGLRAATSAVHAKNLKNITQYFFYKTSGTRKVVFGYSTKNGTLLGEFSATQRGTVSAPF